jgi:hypothetical protein
VKVVDTFHFSDVMLTLCMSLFITAALSMSLSTRANGGTSRKRSLPSDQD